MSEQPVASSSRPPTVVTARSAGDFLAVVPQLVGFLPEESVVIVAFRGTRSCGAMRFNLPGPDASDAVLRRIATTVIGMACKIKGADSVVPVVYTNRSVAHAALPPDAAFVHLVVERADSAGFLTPDALCVGSDAWTSYRRPVAGGHPLAEITSAASLDSSPRTARPLASLQDGATLPAVDRPTKERCVRLLRRYQRALDGEDAALDLVTLFGDVLDPVDLAEQALCWDPGALAAEDAAALVFLAQGPAQRDQMMLQFAFGREVGAVIGQVNHRYVLLQRATGLSLDTIVRLEEDARLDRRADDEDNDGDDGDDGDVGDDGDRGGDGAACGVTDDRILAGDLIMGLHSDRPDPVRVQSAIAVLKTAAALSPRSARPPLFCMLAWLSWSFGRGSVAGIFLDLALSIDPDYSMAVLLHRLIGMGRLPEWVYPAEDE